MYCRKGGLDGKGYRWEVVCIEGGMDGKVVCIEGGMDAKKLIKSRFKYDYK